MEERRFEQWTKQVEIFKATKVYETYGKGTAPKVDRNMVNTLSKRQFDRLIRAWKSSVYQMADDSWTDRKCANCGYRGYYKCPCYRVAYCCRPCQQAHWSKHKLYHE